MADVLGQLSRLSRLTHLSVESCICSSEWTGVFVSALKKLPTLQDLAIKFLADNRDGATAAEGLLLDLVAGLPSLKSIKCENFLENVMHDAFSPGRLHACMRDQSPGLLTRLTGLRFYDMFQAPLETDVALVAMLADMPALQSLELVFDALQYAGFMSLSRVLSGLTGLTHLDLSSNCANDEMVLAVLHGLVMAGAAEQHQLRYLNITNLRVGDSPESAQKVADYFRQLRSLEHLEMSHSQMFDQRETVIEALETLPRLRYLDAREDGEDSGSVRAMFMGRGPVPDMPDRVLHIAAGSIDIWGETDDD